MSAPLPHLLRSPSLFSWSAAIAFRTVLRHTGSTPLSRGPGPPPSPHSRCPGIYPQCRKIAERCPDIHKSYSSPFITSECLLHILNCHAYLLCVHHTRQFVLHYTQKNHLKYPQKNHLKSPGLTRISRLLFTSQKLQSMTPPLFFNSSIN